MEDQGGTESFLPRTSSVLAVCAHPDDESFGLGAALSSWADAGGRTAVLSFTHGEASSLGTALGDLHRLREKELAAAAHELGIETVRLLDHPDGGLSDEPSAALDSELLQTVELVHASLLLVFDEGGITGHTDHCSSDGGRACCRQRNGPPRTGVDPPRTGRRTSQRRVRDRLRRAPAR